MSDDERRGAPRDGRSPRASRPARTQEPRRSGRAAVSTERLAHLDESLGFAPVEGEDPPPSSPPPLPRAQGAPALDRRPPAAHRVAAGGKRATDLGLGELKPRGDASPEAGDPHADTTAVELRARPDGEGDEPTRTGQVAGDLPSVLLSSGLVRARDVLPPGTGTQAGHRRDLASEERVAAVKTGRDRPPLSERRDVDAALVRPLVRREGSGTDPARAQVRGRGLTRRPSRPERPSEAPRRPAIAPGAQRAAILRAGGRGPDAPRVGVRRDPTGPRVGRYAIGEHPDEKTVASEGASTGRSPRKAGVRRLPKEGQRSGRVAAVSARLQREPTDPSRAAWPSEPEPSGRPMVAPNARRQREPTDPGDRPLVAPLTRVQREPTDPSRQPVSRRARRDKAPALARREPTDPGRAARPSLATAQREPTDPGRAARRSLAPAQREPTDPGQGGTAVNLTNPELVPAALQREPTDPGASPAAPAGSLQREPTDPGHAPSSLIVPGGTDPAGRPIMTSPPRKLAARIEAGGPGPGAARPGGLQQARSGPLAPRENRHATVPAGAAGAGSLPDARRSEATESSLSPAQREAKVPVGAARAGVLAERLRRGAPVAENQREATTPRGGARKGALKSAARRATDGGVPESQREPTAPKGAARSGGLGEARQQEATETAWSPRQQEATETSTSPASVTKKDKPRADGGTPPAATSEEATATHEAAGEQAHEPVHLHTAPQGSRGGELKGDEPPPVVDSPLWGAARDEPEPPAEEVPPRLAQHTVTGVLSADERAGLLPSGARREPLGFFKTLSIVSMVLLFEAIALPTSHGAPWALLGDPGGVTFVALAFLLLVIVAHILPVRPTLRAGAALGVGALMAGFSLVVAGAAAKADLFDGQPAVAVVMGGPAGGRVALVLALMALPFGLLWRFLEPERLGPRLAHGVGLALVVFVAVGAGALGLGGGTAVAGALDTLGSAPIFGDRLVAAFGLMPLLVALVSAAGYLPGGRGRRLAVFAVIYWVALAVPLIVAALFVAKSEDWMTVLEPLKVASFVAVPLLYLPAAAATFVATLRRR